MVGLLLITWLVWRQDRTEYEGATAHTASMRSDTVPRWQSADWWTSGYSESSAVPPTATCGPATRRTFTISSVIGISKCLRPKSAAGCISISELASQFSCDE